MSLRHSPIVPTYLYESTLNLNDGLPCRSVARARLQTVWHPFLGHLGSLTVFQLDHKPELRRTVPTYQILEAQPRNLSAPQQQKGSKQSPEKSATRHRSENGRKDRGQASLPAPDRARQKTMTARGEGMSPLSASHNIPWTPTSPI